MIAGELRWTYPLFFLLLLVIPLAAGIVKYLQQNKQGIDFPACFVIQPLQRDYAQYYRHIITLFRCFVLILLVIILVRPQREVRFVDRQVEQLDILLLLDLSESMRAYDIRPDRLTAAKRVLREFIQNRMRDRLGLVVFSGVPLTLSPLTIDHETLLEVLGEVNTNTVQIEGTAMGEALLMAVNRLLDAERIRNVKFSSVSRSDRKGRVIILATDGVNNRGFDPLQAARVVAKKGIKLYTIALGGEKPVVRYEYDRQGKRVPLRDVYGCLRFWEKPDEVMLAKMAEIGGGKYFRAGNRIEFNQVMAEIDRLEKHKVRLKRRNVYQEEYFWFLVLALIFLITEVVLKFIRFRTLV